MSWFYEALKRIEKERTDAGTGEDFGVVDEQGVSFLTALESIASIADPSVSNQRVELDREAPQPALSLPAENLRVSPAEIRVAAAGLEEVEVPKAPPNGFRRVRLPLREESRLVFHTDPMGLVAEQYRLLRRSLIQQFRDAAVLMITSPGQGDGKTMTALNLACCLADGGAPTLLAEVDLRQPTVCKTLGCALEQPGIEDAFGGTVPPQRAVHLIEQLSVHVAAVAAVPRDPSHLVNGRGIKQFLAWAKENFRWIVLDAPPVVPAADVSDLLPLADAVVLVIRAQRTPRDLSKRSFEMLGRRLNGVILNEVTVYSNPYYRYLSHYYHGSKTTKK